MSTKLLLLPLALSGVVLAGCTVTLPGMTTLQPTPETQIMPAASPLPETTQYTLSMDDFSFSEKTLTVTAGSTITLNLTNEKGFHDLVIDELNVKSKPLKAGESQELTIVIPMDAKGKTYAYYCSVGQHRANGMEGTLIIN